MVEQTKAAEEQRKAATAERYPTLTANVDYGDIGVNVRHSHGTADVTGNLERAHLQGICAARRSGTGAVATGHTASADRATRTRRWTPMCAMRCWTLQSAQRQVEVSRSSVELANEALSEAQQSYAAGVSDNLAVSQAEQSVAQANEQYVDSLYRHNVAKLSLARALGAAENYKSYLGGK